MAVCGWNVRDFVCKIFTIIGLQLGKIKIDFVSVLKEMIDVSEWQGTVWYVLNINKVFYIIWP